MKKIIALMCGILVVACSNRSPLPVPCPTVVSSAPMLDAGTPMPSASIQAPIASTPPTVTYEVHFSPKGGCAKAVVAHIAAAKKIRVQAYGFTSKVIADALIAAKARGADVEVILDRSDKTAKNSKASELVAAKIVVFFDSKHPIAHNKVMIFDEGVPNTVPDDAETETGSYNYTDSAENGNAENCIFLKSASLAATYNANWEEHKAHSDLAQ
jgi:phosphatidylserine/phosphatidylglycerophosphate/cardiolipin synthase-like enzyme